MPIPVDHHKFFGSWARFATSRPWLIIAVAFITTLLAGVYAANSISFHSDRSDLIDPSLPWQQRYASMKHRYPRWDDLIVVIDRTSAPDDETAYEFMDALAERLRADDRFRQITAGFDRKNLPAWLLLTEPTERVQSAADSLKRTAPVLSSPSLADLLSLTALGSAALDEQSRHGLTGLLERAAAVAEGAGDSILGIEALSGTERISSAELAIMLVSRSREKDSTTSGVDAQREIVAALRAHIAETRASDARFAPIDAGVTGVPVFESDETTQSMTDATRATILSFILIALLMVIVYRGVIAPMLALVSLIVGIAWSFAWVAVSVGHLQVLSVVFTVVLLGLGIDTAIHLIARLELTHPDHDHMGGALVKTYRSIGPGVMTATATTAAAFAATALTRFAGVAEMGKIAAGGLILCTISVMTVLPALLMVLPRPEKRMRARRGGESRPFAGRLGLWLDKHPRTIMFISFVVLTLAGTVAVRIKYDPDLMKLVPPHAESVVWQNRLAHADAGSVWHAKVIVPDLEEARRIVPRLRALPTVGSLDGAARFAIDDATLAERTAILAALPEPPAGARSPGEVSPDESSRLRDACRSIAQKAGAADPALARAAASLASLPDDALAAVARTYRAERAALASYITALRAADQIELAALPASMSSMFIGTDNSLQILVSPVIEPGVSVLAPDKLVPFAEDVISVAPDATGPTIQIYESSRLIKNAYYDAALFALIAIVVILLIDLRHFRDVVCSAIPVVSGSILMLATMVLIGQELNFANTIVMPLLFGMGVDSGVHAVHRWRQQQEDAPAGLAGGSGRAITLTTLTTVIGFSCMMIAEHRGIRSLGLVMSLGLAYVWISAVVILPAVLRLRTNHRRLRGIATNAQSATN